MHNAPLDCIFWSLDGIESIVGIYDTLRSLYIREATEHETSIRSSNNLRDVPILVPIIEYEATTIASEWKS
jgi:hypothetical protein